ncbi:hypothetical protein KY289_011718 [Solanum tuberosum]|nr:hypothetical protein KY289_011718 [Solanum tuberosum]KAH0710481.1 hypothetical protein KY284_011908 [Solanum tuberosum]
MGERGCEGGWTLQARRTTTFLQIYWIDATAGLLDRIAIWIALLGQFGSWVRVWKKKTSMGSGVGVLLDATSRWEEDVVRVSFCRFVRGSLWS